MQTLNFTGVSTIASLTFSDLFSQQIKKTNFFI
jgi:hypothetical protein